MSRKFRSQTLPGILPSTSNLSMHGERPPLHRSCLRDSSSFLELVAPQRIYDSENDGEFELPPDRSGSMLSLRGRRYSESAVTNIKLEKALKRLKITCNHFNVDDYRPKETRLRRFQRLRSIAGTSCRSFQTAITKSPERAAKPKKTKKLPTPTPSRSPTPTPSPSLVPALTPSLSPSPPPTPLPEPQVPHYDFDRTMELFNRGIAGRWEHTQNKILNEFIVFSRFPECADFVPCGQGGVFFCRLHPSVGIINIDPGTFREMHRTSSFIVNFIMITGTLHFEVAYGVDQNVHKLIMTPFSFLRLGPNTSYSMHNMGEVQAVVMFLRMGRDVPIRDCEVGCKQGHVQQKVHFKD